MSGYVQRLKRLETRLNNGYVEGLKRLEPRLNKLEKILDNAFSFPLVASSVVDIERTGVWYGTLVGITQYDANSWQNHRILEGAPISYHIVSEFGAVNGSIINLAVGLALSAGITFVMYKLSDRMLKSAYSRNCTSSAGDAPSIAKKAPVYVFLAGATAVRVASGILSWPC
jgi:hypothetical protein